MHQAAFLERSGEIMFWVRTLFQNDGGQKTKSNVKGSVAVSFL